MNGTAVLPSSVPAGVADPLLRARGVGRDFGSRTAVSAVDLELHAGTFLTVVGPNGAGKSTLLYMLAGIVRPSRGEITIDGSPVTPGHAEWRSRVGLVSHQTMLYAHLSAEENLRFFGRLYDVPELRARIHERLEMVGLAGRARERVRDLSHGMRQRLSLARALLHDPDVVLLDEPYTGLDPHAASVLRLVLESLRERTRTVVMVTHNLREGLALADRVAVQVAGRFAWTGPAPSDADAFEAQYHRVVAGALS